MAISRDTTIEFNYLIKQTSLVRITSNYRWFYRVIRTNGQEYITKVYNVGILEIIVIKIHMYDEFNNDKLVNHFGRIYLIISDMMNEKFH